MAGIDTGNSKDKFSINLYPMLDIFSILIVFLLMNYSTEGQSVETMENLQLPLSHVKLSLDDAPTVSITKKELVIQGGALAMPLTPDGDVEVSERSQGAILKAYEVFKKLKESNETLKNRDKSLNLSERDVGTLTMEADKDIQFKLIKRVMLSAQQAEFISWKLAVSKAEIN